MVTLPQILASNSSISTALPSGMVAVFVGATSGIGEYTMKAFAKHAREPRIYFVGRSQEAADRIVDECRKLNPSGEYIFISADVSLIRNVDEVCKEIQGKEKYINLLFLTQGTLSTGKETSEGLSMGYALAYASRYRFTQNLLPLIQQSNSLKRVVSVLAGTKEGPINESDWEGRNFANLMNGRGHVCSMVTLSLEILAKSAPDVTFIHEYPGYVRSNIGRDVTSFALKAIFAVLGMLSPFLAVPNEESGERHVFLATSDKFPPARRQASENTGVPIDKDIETARGTDGTVGSGVYSIDWNGESAPLQVEHLLEQLKQGGTLERLQRHTDETLAQTANSS